jgi:hypothetical protein
MAIIIISFIAAFGFSSTAKKKGYVSPRFWIYPVAVGFGVWNGGFALGLLCTWIAGNEVSMFSKTYPFAINLFSILLALSLISKAWREIKSLPNRRKEEIEQFVAPNPSLPPSLNSTSSVRASEES